MSVSHWKVSSVLAQYIILFYSQTSELRYFYLHIDTSAFSIVLSRCVSPSMYSVPDVGFFFPVTKFIRIGIADKNDNPPYFDKELYEAEVDENEDIQHTVLTVTAKDHDECKYIAVT